MTQTNTIDEIDAQIYLITPSILDLNSFSSNLISVLDAVDIACIRMRFAAKDEGEIRRAADTIRDICHDRDIAVLIEDHYKLVTPLGLDGVHLTDGGRNFRDVRKELGADALIGVYCHSSRHQGLSLGELGADYISFGPLETDGLGSDETAPIDLFQWWSDVVEVPVVAEKGISWITVNALRHKVDFLAIGDEIWTQKSPTEALKSLLAE